MAACIVVKSDLIPARMLNELVDCPRLFHLEHVAGEWAESADTVSGKRPSAGGREGVAST